MPNADAGELRPNDHHDGAVRVHAFEFGTPLDGRGSGGSRFRDLRVTNGFPASAAWRARLGGLDVRANDLWRLVHPAAGDGAILVWPACPARKAVRAAVDGDEAAGSPATRVISLIRVDFPSIRAARWRASLNARSIVVAEEDWQHFAPSLAARAPAILRTEFDAIVANGGGWLRLPELSIAAPSCDPDNEASSATILLRSMISRRPFEIGRDDIESESAFWALAAGALAALPAKARGDLSLASGFAPPFVPNAFRYVPIPCAPAGRRIDGAVPGAVSQRHDASRNTPPNPTSPQCAAFGQLLSGTAAVRGPSGVDELCTALSGPKGPPYDLIREIARQFGDRAGEIARQLYESNQSDWNSPLDLDLLDGVANVARCLPVEGSAAAFRARLLDRCEDHLIGCFAGNGFLCASDLRRLQTSAALAALVRRIIERRPHAIVARLQVSLTMLAHGEPAAVELLDDCLRVLLPPRWPANEWLALFDQEWTVQRALATLRRAQGQLAEDEFARLEGGVLNRLSCSTFVAERSRRLDLVRTAPQVQDRPVKHPA
jgi:hypothetical protein